MAYHRWVLIRDVSDFRLIALELEQFETDLPSKIVARPSGATGRMGLWIAVREMELPPAAADRLEVAIPVVVVGLVRRFDSWLSSHQWPNILAVNDPVFGRARA